MNIQDERTIRVIGEESFEKLQNKHVLIFGLGGVGGYVVEGLVRAGIKHFTIVDNDVVQESNLNRQIIALYSTIGQKKVDVVEKRILEIRKDAIVNKYEMFYLPEVVSNDFFEGIDYIVDAIDTMTAKIDLVMKAKELNIPIISCMGTGNKLNPSMLEITDIKNTSYDPIAKRIRKYMKDNNLKRKLPVVYSKEQNNKFEGSIPSMIFVPSTAGLLCANYVIRKIIEKSL